MVAKLIRAASVTLSLALPVSAIAAQPECSIQNIAAVALSAKAKNSTAAVKHAYSLTLSAARNACGGGIVVDKVSGDTKYEVDPSMEGFTGKYIGTVTTTFCCRDTARIPYGPYPSQPELSGADITITSDLHVVDAPAVSDRNSAKVVRLGLDALPKRLNNIPSCQQKQAMLLSFDYSVSGIESSIKARKISGESRYYCVERKKEAAINRLYGAAETAVAGQRVVVIPRLDGITAGLVRGPDACSPPIDVVNTGDRGTIISEDEVLCGGGVYNWKRTKVRFDNGTEGWIPSWRIKATSLGTGGNLLQNAGFEISNGVQDDKPLSWTSRKWGTSACIFTRDVTVKRTGSASGKVQCYPSTPNDARWYQNVELEPNRTYRLSGWVKTRDVVAQGQRGASVVPGANTGNGGGYYENVPNLKGTNDWTYLSYEFTTGADTSSYTAEARLGYFASLASGEAWFDDLKLEAK